MECISYNFSLGVGEIVLVVKALMQTVLITNV